MIFISNDQFLYRAKVAINLNLHLNATCLNYEIVRAALVGDVDVDVAG